MSVPGYSGGGAAAGVSSFNTRQGAVVLAKADVTGTGLAAGDVAAIAVAAEGVAGGVATLDGTANVPAGQLGNAALAHDQNHLAASVPIPATSTWTDIISTTALGIGTWLISASITLLNTGATGGFAGIRVSAGTATAAIAGAPSAGCNLAGGVNAAQAVTVSCVVTVTVAGTMKIQGWTNTASTLTAQFEALTGADFTSGYTAIKIA